VANSDHLERLAEGAPAWNAWRSEQPRVHPDLRQAHLAEANLRGYDLHDTDLRGASLLGAKVERADLRGADLSDCDLRFLEWRRARLSGAKLRDAKGADDALIAAAARVDWRDRIPRENLGRVAIVLAVAALAWALAARTYPDGLSAHGGSPAIDLAATMSEAGLTQWTVEGVAISGGLMRLRLSADEIHDDAYLSTLRAACRALKGRSIAPPVERIEVLQTDGKAGWLFEQTSHCPDVLRTSGVRLAAVVAPVSRPIRPKPGSDDAR
jgi:hypothetical protein